MKIRIATFNTENPFARYNSREGKSSLATNGFNINDLAFTLYSDSSKKITVQAIKEVNADIICLQEVENISVLERFNSQYLAKLKYRHRILIDAHGPSSIDLGYLSHLVAINASPIDLPEEKCPQNLPDLTRSEFSI